MSWHLLEKSFDEIGKQSTFIGRIWIIILFVFRIIAVTRIGDVLYGDEQAAFKCNTKQVGCDNVCFNEFSPISHIRFWGFQIILVATPAIMFMVYAVHAVSLIPGTCKLSGRQLQFSTKVSGEKRKRGQFKVQPSSSVNAKGPKTRQGGTQHSPNKKKTNSAPGWERWSREQSPRQILRPTAPPPDSLNGSFMSSTVFDRYYQQDYPPPYNDYNNHFCDEIGLKNITIPTSTPTSKRELFCRDGKLTTRCQLDSKSVYPRLNALLDRLPDLDQRRYSDGYLARNKKHPERNQHHRFVDTSSSPSTETTDMSRSDCQASDNSEPNFVWQMNETSKLPMSLINIAPNSTQTVTCENRLLYDVIQPKSNYSSPKLPVPKQATSQPRSRLGSKTHIKQPNTLQNKTVISYLNEEDSSSKASIQNGSTCNFVEINEKNNTSSVSSLVVTKKFIEKIENRIAVAYFVHCVLRVLIEITFLILQYLFFSFKVPELYKCQRWPCPNTVDCFVSRPEEKTIMIYFMFGVTVVCIAITLAEIVYLLCVHIKSAKHKRKLELAAKRQRRLVAAGLSLATPNAFGKFSKHCDPNRKFDISKHPYLLDGNKRFRRYSVEELSDSESSKTDSSRTTPTESESDELEHNSFESNLSDMMDAEMIDAAGYNEQQNEQLEYA
ncbi:uncharacterized protein LOC143465457 isoform X2 [Clavelina lepadiformis]|uniref:uncharacterized protein LOC143465457 isoform X2 n=1 Tax=Clavelina lepadiformis TaxID=159417 RepID=UPI004041A90A